MCMEIYITVKSDYIYLRCTGDVSPEEVKKLFSRSIDAMFEHGISKVLIDVKSVTGDLTTMDRIECADFLADEILNRALGKVEKITVVGDEPPLDPCRIGEVLARGRGVNVMVTTDLDEAIWWIKLSPRCQW